MNEWPAGAGFLACATLKMAPMRQEESFFGQQELALLYIAKRLKEAQSLEIVLDAAGVDYLVEADTYRGGFIFISERVGAFFYTDDASTPRAREAMAAAGYRPFDPESGGQVGGQS